jgi:uncharacterized protein YndB with AHSA1/START domain
VTTVSRVAHDTGDVKNSGPRADNRLVDGERGLRLHLEKVVAAPVEQVFSACLDPDELSRWWGPAGFTAPLVSLDARVGGAYRIRMQPPEGEAFHLRGEFTEIDPPRRLGYTFEWEEPDPDDRRTEVALSFLEQGEGTTIVLDQGPFATDDRRALHETGWTETLERLAGHFAT